MHLKTKEKSKKKPQRNHRGITEELQRNCREKKLLTLCLL
jgi:hypothetical protein